MDDVLIHVCDKVSSMDVQKFQKLSRNSNGTEIQMQQKFKCHYDIDAIMALMLLWH